MLPAIPADIEPWLYYLCVGAAVLITAVSKGGFGGGAGILAIPLMALVIGPIHMLGIMLPLLIACDVLSNLHYLRAYDWTRLRWLLPGAAGGVLFGTLILLWLRGMPPQQLGRAMSGMIGAICLAVVALQLYRLSGREPPALPDHHGTPLGVGFVAGGVSTLNHAAGPIVTIYLLRVGLDKRHLVGTLLLYFLLINTAKLPTYLLLPIADGRPLINLQTLRDSIWFIPLIPLGTLAGAWMNRRIPEKPFLIVMYTAAALAAAHLLYKATMSGG